MEINSLLVREASALREAFRVTSRVLKTAFIVDKRNKFLGVITDGDIRRALIAGAKMEDAVSNHYSKESVFIKKGKLNKIDFDPQLIHIIPVLNDVGEVIGYKTPKELKKVAFITGVTGQDGAYLAYFLLKKGYVVIGGYRRTSFDSFERLRRIGILDKIIMESFDITDMSSIIRIIEKYEPVEIYNLAAQSFVHVSFNEPYSTSLYTGLSVLNFLEAIRITEPSIRFYQASSSEMFGNSCEPSQSENTPFKPSSPYAVAKVFGHMLTENYKESYGLFACSSILFNHESPLRGLEFVTRKITHSAAKIKLGLGNEIRLGNLKAKRDWGYAYDYVKAMWLMLQQDKPDYYVLGTGRSYSVEEFAQKTCDYLGLDYKKYIKIDDKYFRPCEVEELTSNPKKAVEKLGWNPSATSIDKLIKIMVDADIDYLQGKTRIKVIE